MDQGKKAAQEAPAGAPAKLVWERPTIEEIDFRAAEAGVGAYNFTDFTTYTS